jgi:Putative hemolysin
MTDLHLLKLNFKDQDFFIIENIRNKVFADELNIAQSELFDDLDSLCDHFLIFDGVNIVGSVRIIVLDDKVKLERMAILKEYRTKKLRETMYFTNKGILFYIRFLTNNSGFNIFC